MLRERGNKVLSPRKIPGQCQNGIPFWEGVKIWVLLRWCPPQGWKLGHLP